MQESLRSFDTPDIIQAADAQRVRGKDSGPDSLIDAAQATDPHRESSAVLAASVTGAARLSGLLPEFVPLPSGNSVEYHTGLKRGKLNQLILPCKENGGIPPVKSICLRPKGCTKGKRLIVLSSLLDYLRKQAI